MQHLVRAAMPKAFRRNYSIRSLGAANQQAIEAYVATQLQHHPMADPRIETMLAPYQFAADRVDLGRPRRSGHGEFIYNLHLVAVHEQRFAEVNVDCCRRTVNTLQAAARKKGHLLSRVGLLVDHVHWTVGYGVEESPLEVGLSYLNNLAYAHGMRPLYHASRPIVAPPGRARWRREVVADADASRPVVAPPGRARWRHEIVAGADASRPIVAPPGRTRWRRSGSFASRTRNIYCHQAERAGEPLPYTLAELREVVTEALAVGTCPYCGWALNEANFSVDHHNPISRDGDFTTGNILDCHLRCNKITGNLTSHEFLHLAAFLAQFPPEVGKDVLARLYAGGRFMRRR